jgi:hypothetical protein
MQDIENVLFFAEMLTGPMQKGVIGYNTAKKTASRTAIIEGTGQNGEKTKNRAGEHLKKELSRL